MAARNMHFVGFVIAGPTWHHYGSWRHPESDGLDALDPARYEEIARTLERGKFDGLFFVDYMMLFDTFGGGFRTNLREAGQQCMLEPTQLLAAMARVTSKIGLAATMSTTFLSPIPYSPDLCHARSHQSRPGRVECRDIVNGERSQELRHGQPAGQIPQVRSGR